MRWRGRIAVAALCAGVGLARAQGALELAIDAARFDPPARTVALSGTPGAHAVPRAVFLDALRLAREEHDPWLRVEPADAAPWDRQGIAAGDRVRSRFLETDAGRTELVGRLRDAGVGAPAGDRIVWAAALDRLAPQLAARLARPVDLRATAVFSPRWLRFAELGKILLEGDLALGSVVAGLAWTPGGPSPDVGSIRFALAAPAAVDGDGAVALADVRPELVVEARAGGECARCRAIEAQLARRWPELADRVPAIGRLALALRAYAAARYLVRAHPALALCVDDLPAPPTDGEASTELTRALVLRFVTEGQAFTADAQAETVGYAGGLSLAAPERASAEGLAAERGAPGAASLAVALDGPALPGARVGALWVALVLAVVLAHPLIRVLEPDGGGGATPRAPCAPCRQVHATAERIVALADRVATGTVLALAVLPFAVAGLREPLGAGTIALAGLQIAAGATAAGLAARGLARRSGLDAGVRTLTGRGPDHVGAGLRWGGGLFAVWALTGWLTGGGGRLAARIGTLCGREVAERVLAGLPGPAWALAPWIVLLACAAAGVHARLFLPLAAGSRPLADAGRRHTAGPQPAGEVAWPAR